MRPLCVAFVLLLFASTPLSFAFSVQDIIDHNSENMWYAGENLSPGDSFSYSVCDNTQRFIVGDHCYDIRLDFFAEMISGNNDVWVVQAEIHQNNSTKYHIFLIDSDTMQITTDYVGSKFANSMEDTVLYLLSFAYKESPKNLKVGSIWGTVPSRIGDLNVVVSSTELFEDSNGTIHDTYSIQYGFFKSSVFLVSPDIAFPVYAVTYDTYVANHDPRILFTFELQDHMPGEIQDIREIPNKNTN